MYYKIEKSNIRINKTNQIKQKNLTLESPRYYKATIIKPGKEYKLTQQLN